MSGTPRSVQFSRSLSTGRDRLQVRRSEYATGKHVRLMLRCSAEHFAKCLLDRLRIRYLMMHQEGAGEEPMATFIVVRPGRCLDMGSRQHALCKKAKAAPLP